MVASAHAGEAPRTRRPVPAQRRLSVDLVLKLTQVLVRRLVVVTMLLRMALSLVLVGSLVGVMLVGVLLIGVMFLPMLVGSQVLVGVVLVGELVLVGVVLVGGLMLVLVALALVLMVVLVGEVLVRRLVLV